MAASDLAFVGAKNAAQADERAQAAEKNQEQRQQTADERSEILFNRSTTLFEQQQKFIKDERRLMKFGRDANSAIALFRATKGQVFQPVLDLYDEIPDGGKFHQFRRNDNGTFDFDIEWQGQRYTKQGANFEAVGKMAMSIANPTMYLQESGAAATAESEHIRAKEIAAIKALGKKKSDTQGYLIDGKLEPTKYGSLRGQFLEEYTQLMNDDPELLEIPDAAAEDGVRRETFEEYAAKKFNAIGINVSGASIDEDGNINAMPPPNPLSASFTETREFMERRFGLNNTGESVDAAVEAFIKENREDELIEMFLSNPDAANTLTPEQESKILRSKAAKDASKGDPEAQRKDKDEAGVIVYEGEDTKKTPPSDPFEQFRENIKGNDDGVKNAITGVKKLAASMREIGKSARKRASIQIWSDVASGNSTRSEARMILMAGADPAGLKIIANEYRSVRNLLPADVKKTLDKVFAKPTAIPEYTAGPSKKSPPRRIPPMGQSGLQRNRRPG